MTQIDYQLRIRNAADSADAIVITSVRGGTNPYLADPPTGDGATYDPRTSDSMLGAYTGTIADWPIGSMQRVITSQLEDGNFRQQLGYRKAILEFQINGGGFSGNVLTAGYLTLLKLVDAATWFYTISDPMAAQRIATLFGPASTTNITTFLAAWPNRGCILGGPIMTPAVSGRPGKVIGISDLGGWSMRVETTAISGEYFLRPVSVYGPTDNWQSKGQISEDLAHVINDAVVPFQSAYNNGKADPWTTIKDTQTNYWAWSGLTVLINGVPWKPLAYIYGAAADSNGILLPPPLVSPVKGSNGTGLHVKSDGTRTLTNGTIVKVRVLSVLPTETCPIYVEGHPVDVLSTFWTAAGIPFSSSDCTTLKHLIGEDAWIALRLTSARALADLSATICQPYGIGIRGNGSGELVPYRGREVGNTPPVTTVTSAHVVDGSTTLPFELDLEQALQTITFRQQRFASALVMPGKAIVDQVAVSDDELTVANGDTTAVPFGTLDIETEAFIQTASAKSPMVFDFWSAAARTLFDRFGHGPIAAETTLLRGAGSNDSINLGDEILLQLPELPNHNYRLGDNPAIAARAMQVVRRTVLPEGYAIRLLDSGPNAQPLATVPTVSIAASSDAPRTVAEVTITNAATLNGLGYGARLQWAVNQTGAAPASTQYTDLAAYNPGQIPTGVIRISPVIPGSTIYVQGRSEGVLTSRPSNYGTPAHVTLSALNSPTSVVAAPSGSDGSQCTLTWTPGSGTSADYTDIWLRLSGGAFSTASRIAVLNPGSNRYVLEGLTPGVAYTASVQHRDPTNGDTSDPVDVTFTAGGITLGLTAPANPVGFAGSPDPDSGAPLRDGVFGIAVVAAVFPGSLEVAVAVETSVGSGTYGAFATVATIPNVLGNWTKWAGIAPNDGLRRQIKARHVRDGATASAYCTTITVTPWVPLGLPNYPTNIIVQLVINAPANDADAQTKVSVTVNAIDPQGGSTKVALTSLTSNSSILSGAAVNSYVASGSTWVLARAAVLKGSAAGEFTGDDFGVTGVRAAKAYVDIPEQGQQAAPVITMTPKPDGHVETRAIGNNDTLSYTWAEAAGVSPSMPSDATAIAGTVVNGSVVTITSTATIALGERYLIKVVPWPQTSAGGTHGQIVSGSVDRQNKSQDKEYRIGCPQFSTSAPTTDYFREGAFVYAVNGAAAVKLSAFVDLPKNTTINTFILRAGSDDPTLTVTALFRKANASATPTTISTLSITPNGGQQTVSASPAETLDGSAYYVEVTLDASLRAPNPSTPQLIYVEFHYTAALLTDTI